jgi:hypothetical protein
MSKVMIPGSDVRGTLSNEDIMHIRRYSIKGIEPALLAQRANHKASAIPFHLPAASQVKRHSEGDTTMT